MSKIKIIRTEIRKPGQGDEAHEYEHCPLKEQGTCRLYGLNCDYGLTEIDVPSFCAMKIGEIVIKIKAI